MSGTLERLGSIRRSLRHPKKLLVAPESKHGKDACTSSSMPEKVEEAGLKEGNSSKHSRQTYFRLSVADASISVNKNYRPSYLRLVVCRRKSKYRSELIPWEPSFKCTSSGSVVWPHPFECTIAITPPSVKDSKLGTLRNKDITISLQNVEKSAKHNSSKPNKKSKKTLAKVRLNLADYYESASNIHEDKHDTDTSTYKASSLKIKLRPESSKVANASINLTIQRTNFNPSALLQIPADINEKDTDKYNKEISPPSSPIILNKAIEPDRLSSSEASSVDTISQKSQSDSPIESPVKLVLVSEGKKINPKTSPIATSTLSPASSTNQSNSQLETKNDESKIGEKSSYKIPPPLPLRDWQKNNSTTSEKLDKNQTYTISDKKLCVTEDKPVIEHIDPVQRSEQLEIANQQEIENIVSVIDSDKDNQVHVNDLSSDDGIKARIVNESTSTLQNENGSTLRLPDSSPIEIASESKVEYPALEVPMKSLDESNTIISDEDKESKKAISIRQPIFATPEKSVVHRIKVPPSPVMRPNKPNEKEKLLIEWANKILSSQDPPIKITNLFTSWQNGLGFCALIRKHYPNLIPPINQLKTDQRSQNCQLAIEAAGLLGIETSSFICKESKEGMILDKTAVKLFLLDLKSTFENAETVELSEKTVIEYQCQWYEKAKYFGDVVEEVIRQKEIENKKAQEEARLKEQAEKDRIVQEQQEKGREEARKKLYENGEQVGLSKNGRRTDEVHNLIQEAYDSASKELDQSQNLVSSDLPDTDDSSNILKKVLPDEEQKSPDSEPTSSASTTQEYQSCKEEDRSNTDDLDQIHSGMPESKTIAEELFLLTKEETRIAREKDELEEVLREEEYDPNEHEIIMQKWMQLVNQKNSVVRRQMQLNIREKEKIVSYDLSRIQHKLQSFNGLDDSRKTDAMKDEEQKLIESHVALVNKKNELVLQLDTQEQAIADDERIQALVARRDFVTLQREEGCRLQ